MKLWDVLASDYYGELVKELALTPFSESEFDIARVRNEDDNCVPVYRAKNIRDVRSRELRGMRNLARKN